MSVPAAEVIWSGPADLRPLLRSLADLRPDPDNARRHDRRNLDAVARSLELYGQRQAVVVGPDGVIVAGHARVEAARRLGWTHVVCVAADDLDDRARRAYAIADNRTAELATWDQDRLAVDLQALAAAGAEVPGFDLAALDVELRGVERLAAAAAGVERGFHAVGKAVPHLDALAAAGPPASRRGETYALGPHRLRCGDALDPADVAALMGDERAALCATDPPYCVGYEGTAPNSPPAGMLIKDSGGLYHDPADAADFYGRLWAAAAAGALADRAAVYCWHADLNAPALRAALAAAGVRWHQGVVWVKGRAAMSRTFYRPRHEPCAVGFYGRIPNRGYRSLGVHGDPLVYDTVWDVPWDDGTGEGEVGRAPRIGHPTVKPVELFARPMRLHLPAGGLAYEPCAGSGTAIIAAAREGRRCYALEIEPVFADLVRRRWTAWARAAGQDPGPGSLDFVSPEAVASPVP